ncbi:hypothetical protein GSB9_00602 [Flavobacteriaceae bacterium GSB9]|nr:hypothetical protein GSB9_00602 [Flavobacteriaceae bacterium GSB9]
MKPYILLLALLLSSILAQAQIDSRKKSIGIPAIESKTDSIDASPITPSKTIEKQSDFEFNMPKVTPKLEMPKKEFSMFPEEDFGNPGELYTKKLDKIEKEFLPEGHGEYAGLKEDAYWGDYTTTSEYVVVQYRDSGREDGDLLGVLLDDDFIKSRELLSNAYKGVKIKLKKGLNKIEFLALNEGSLIPNTAQYRIIDDKDKVITGRIWGLSSGVKVTVIIVKE